MATTPLKLSVHQARFGRRGGTGVSPVGIRAHFARDLLADMKAAYFAADRPWVVGFSGGKDSTALVQFRWCTDRLKIHPVSNFIKSVVDRSGAVVVVLGARKSESDTRAQTMDANEPCCGLPGSVAQIHWWQKELKLYCALWVVWDAVVHYLTTRNPLFRRMDATQADDKPR